MDLLKLHVMDMSAECKVEIVLWAGSAYICIDAVVYNYSISQAVCVPYCTLFQCDETCKI